MYLICVATSLLPSLPLVPLRFTYYLTGYTSYNETVTTSSSKGTKADLIRRLQQYKDDRARKESDGSDRGLDTECDAILVVLTEIGSEEDMKGTAKGLFTKESEEEELCIDDVRGKISIGTRRGLNLAGLPEEVSFFC